MIVCICGGVTTEDILQSDIDDLENFKIETGACIQCCKCCDILEELWSRKMSSARPNKR